MPDPKYCYPDSNVLRNKLNITDANLLTQAEIECTSVRLLGLWLHPVKGGFDFKHLCDIHERIFRDLFEWAGKPRTVNIGKGNLFCLVPNIQSFAEAIFAGFYRDCFAVRDDREEFVRVLAKYYGDLNALHPFREGNGRTQREFTRELCHACGYAFDLTHTHHREMLEASIRSFNIDNAGLERIFDRAVIPLAVPERREK